MEPNSDERTSGINVGKLYKESAAIKTDLVSTVISALMYQTDPSITPVMEVIETSDKAEIRSVMYLVWNDEDDGFGNSVLLAEFHHDLDNNETFWKYLGFLEGHDQFVYQIELILEAVPCTNHNSI